MKISYLNAVFLKAKDFEQARKSFIACSDEVVVDENSVNRVLQVTDNFSNFLKRVPESALNFVHFGTLEFDERVETIIQTLVDLASRYPDLVFLITVTKDLEQYLPKSFVDRYNVLVTQQSFIRGY